MRKAAALDVTVYEDPIFYDRLERARVQATDRLAMIQQMGRLIQQTVTAIAFSAVLIKYSPLLLFLLVAGIIPAFLGESHFAFLTYAKNFRQTPLRRQMDYLRQVGGSKEAAKELKLFNLSKYLTERFSGLSQTIYEENVALNRRRLFWGGLLAILGQLGYYAAYGLSIYRTIEGRYSIGDLTLITTSIMQAMSNIQQAFSTASGVADQALFLTDLLAFFEMKPHVQSKENGLPAPRPIVRGSGHFAASFERLQFHAVARRACGADWRERPGQDDGRQADYAALRPERGPGAAGRGRSSRIRPRQSARGDWRDLSGFHALRDDCAGKYCGGAHRNESCAGGD
jgi:ATP-binding cassette subfamily B protein